MIANILRRCANSEAKSLISNDKFMPFIFWHGYCGNEGHAVNLMIRNDASRLLSRAPFAVVLFNNVKSDRSLS